MSASETPLLSPLSVEFFDRYDELGTDARSLADARKQLQSATQKRDRLQAKLQHTRQAIQQNQAFIKEQEDRIALVSSHWFYGTTAFQPQLWLRGGCSGKVERAQAKLQRAKETDQPKLEQDARSLQRQLAPLEQTVRACTERRNQATDAAHERDKMKERALAEHPSALLSDLKQDENQHAQRLKKAKTHKAQVDKLVATVQEEVVRPLERAKRCVRDAESTHREHQQLLQSRPVPPPRSRHSSSRRVTAENVSSSRRDTDPRGGRRHQHRADLDRLRRREEQRNEELRHHESRQALADTNDSGDTEADAAWRDYERSLRRHEDRVRRLEQTFQEEEDRAQTELRKCSQALRNLVASLTSSSAVGEALPLGRREELCRAAVEASDALSSSSFSGGGCSRRGGSGMDLSRVRSMDGMVERTLMRTASLSGLLERCQREHQDTVRSLQSWLSKTRDAMSVEKDLQFERLREEARERDQKRGEDDQAFVAPPPVNPEAAPSNSGLGAPPQAVAASAPVEEDFVEPLAQGKTVISRDYGA